MWGFKGKDKASVKDPSTSTWEGPALVLSASLARDRATPKEGCPTFAHSHKICSPKATCFQFNWGMCQNRPPPRKIVDSPLGFNSSQKGHRTSKSCTATCYKACRRWWAKTDFAAWNQWRKQERSVLTGCSLVGQLSQHCFSARNQHICSHFAEQAHGGQDLMCKHVYMQCRAGLL